jgi:hypothetical protein
MRKDLIRRLEKLEGRSDQFQVDGVFWVASDGKERRGTLSADERIVHDWYLDSDDRLSSVKQRVTADPSEVGLNYKNGGSGYRIDDASLQREIITVGRSRFCRVVRDSGADRDSALKLAT